MELIPLVLGLIGYAVLTLSLIVGGLLFLSGTVLMAVNLYRTFAGVRTVTVHAPVAVLATDGAVS